MPHGDSTSSSSASFSVLTYIPTSVLTKAIAVEMPVTHARTRTHTHTHPRVDRRVAMVIYVVGLLAIAFLVTCIQPGGFI